MSPNASRAPSPTADGTARDKTPIPAIQATTSTDGANTVDKSAPNDANARGDTTGNDDTEGANGADKGNSKNAPKTPRKRKEVSDERWELTGEEMCSTCQKENADICIVAIWEGNKYHCDRCREKRRDNCVPKLTEEQLARNEKKAALYNKKKREDLGNAIIKPEPFSLPPGVTLADLIKPKETGPSENCKNTCREIVKACQDIINNLHCPFTVVANTARIQGLAEGLGEIVGESAGTDPSRFEELDDNEDFGRKGGSSRADKGKGKGQIEEIDEENEEEPEDGEESDDSKSVYVQRGSSGKRAVVREPSQEPARKAAKTGTTTRSGSGAKKASGSGTKKASGSGGKK